MASVQSYYKAKRATNLTNPTSATTFLQADNALKSAFVKLAGTTGDTNLRFYVSVRGRATTGTSSSFIPTLQFNKNVNDLTTTTGSATSANNTTLFAVGTQTLGTITRPWTIDVILLWDSTSQRLTGQSNAFSNEVASTSNAAISALTGVDLTTGTCGCMVSVIFGSSNAGNLATIDDFFAEVV
jgi:hypothetical protein